MAPLLQLRGFKPNAERALGSIKVISPARHPERPNSPNSPTQKSETRHSSRHTKPRRPFSGELPDAAQLQNQVLPGAR